MVPILGWVAGPATLFLGYLRYLRYGSHGRESKKWANAAYGRFEVLVPAEVHGVEFQQHISGRALSAFFGFRSSAPSLPLVPLAAFGRLDAWAKPLPS